jgi:hypothetical protein
MANNLNRTGIWNDQVWGSIDSGVKDAVGAIRVAQKVFPTTQLADVTSVPADVFNPEQMSIAEGHTRPYIELAVEFPLTNGQANEDLTGATGITLAKLAAKALALAEDMLIFQGNAVALPHAVRIESGGESVGNGLLGLIPSDRHIVVQPPDPRAPTNSGGEILAAVAKGIALLTRELQAPHFALIEDTNAFAATWGSVINGAPAHTVLEPVLAGGIYGTGGMAPNTGLLVALGGDPTTIYFSNDPPSTEYTYKGSAGQYFFRTFERIQYVARDYRAFVKLDFAYLTAAESTRTNA